MQMTIDLADAVTSQLNQSEIITNAKRMVLPIHDLSQLRALTVSVVPRGVQVQSITRKLSQYDCQVDIGIQQKLTVPQDQIDTAVKDLSGFVQQIADYLQRQPLTDMPYAIWIKVENVPIYDPDHLANQRVFTSVLTLTYRITK
tara:strand:- start:1 stop:432 length:432 start_codon:yes stop_codon:yes gene_type:complete